MGFAKVPRRPIALASDLELGTFSREAVVAGTKCDTPVCLRDRRLLLIECKVSNSAVNSVKRLNREVGGKAARWHQAFGTQAITSAVLAGVFKLKNLQVAQNAEHAKVIIFWEHDLQPLADFIAEAA